MIRRRYRFYGRVQGVGFRYRAKQAASLYGVTGWVENEWDGSVSMEAQGEPSDIDKMVEAIGRGFFVEIERTEAERIDVIEGERGFGAR